jgi:hypothetical protein
LTPFGSKLLRHCSRPLVLACFFVLSLSASEIDSSFLQKDSAFVVSAAGQVSTEKRGQDWAIGPAEQIPVTKPVFTGEDGYARFRVAGGTSFEVFAHSYVVFRKNPGNPEDLLDITTGRVRVQTQASAEQPLASRILTPVSIIVCHGAATFAIAVDDEDNTTRIDVQQGEVFVQHALLPQKEPLMVKAGDAISIQSDEALIVRRLDRGSLYRYAFHTILKTLGSAIPGHPGKDSRDDASDEQFLAANIRAHRLPISGNR